MSEPSFGGYPGLSQNFENVRSMYPHSGGRVSPQIQTNADFATYMRYHHLANMQGGYSPPGVSKIGMHQAAVAAKYDTLPVLPIQSALNTAAKVGTGLATGYIGVKALTSILQKPMIANLPYVGKPLAIAGTFLSTTNLGKMLTTAGEIAGKSRIPIMGRLASTLLRGAGATAGFLGPLGWAGIAGTQLLSSAINAGIDTFQGRRQEIRNMQSALSGANFYGTDMAYAGSPNISGRAAKELVDVFKANTKVSKRFKAGELDSVMQYSLENGLMEGHTGNAGQFSSRILSLAKVAKDIMQMGAGISAKDAMDLQSMASKLGMNRNALTSGRVVKDLVNAAKISGATLEEVTGRAAEAGAQYLTMGFSAKQGMKLSAYSTRGASTMISNGMLSDEDMSRLGGKSGVENAIFRAGTIAMQNNSQLLALGTLKFRDGKVESDARIMEEYRKGRISFDEISLMARKNMAKLQDPATDKHTQRMMLAAVEAGMPGMVKSISESMSAEQQMTLAGEAILQKAPGSGGIKAAMDEYFGEDTQAKEAFTAYIKNFRKVNNKLREQDVLDEVESVKRASMGEVRGTTQRFIESSMSNMEYLGEVVYDYTAKSYADKLADKEHEEMEEAAGYFGGKRKNSLLSRSEGNYDNITVQYSSDKMMKALSKIDPSKIMGVSAGYNQSAYLRKVSNGFASSNVDIDSYKAVLGFNIGESEDTGFFGGDRDKDILDKMSGRFYSDSYTNSLLNLVTLDPLFREDRDRESLTTIAESADAYMAYQDSFSSDRLKEEKIRLAASVGSSRVGFDSRNKLRNMSVLEAAIDQQLEGYTNTWTSRNNGLTHVFNNIKNTAGSNFSTDEINSILASRLRKYKDSSDPADSNKSVAAAQMLEDMRASANVLDLKSLNTDIFDRKGDIGELSQYFLDIDRETKTAAPGDDAIGQKEMQNVLDIFMGGDMEGFLKDTDSAEIGFIEKISSVTGKRLSERTASNLLAIRKKLVSSKGEEREKLMAGLRNLHLLRGTGTSFEEIMDISQGTASIQIAQENLKTYGGEVSGLANVFDVKGGGRQNLVTKHKSDTNLTLSDIVGNNNIGSLAAESKKDIEAALGKYNRMQSGQDKEKMLEDILQRVAGEYGRAPKGQDKNAKNLPQVMELLYSGIEQFNTHMKTIASGIDKEGGVKITISK